MPIYEYQCDGCADRFEVKQSMKDDALTTCQKCGKHVQRLISSPAIMFKGSGWYVTDYSDKMKPSSGSEAPAPKTGEKKEVATTTSEQSTAANAAPASPASTPAAAPASTPSSPASTASSSTASSTPSSSAAK
ncbi:MAG: FmdB family zinc ribbon protein [Nitrospiraceae bacterium]